MEKHHQLDSEYKELTHEWTGPAKVCCFLFCFVFRLNFFVMVVLVLHDIRLIVVV